MIKTIDSLKKAEFTTPSAIKSNRTKLFNSYIDKSESVSITFFPFDENSFMLKLKSTDTVEVLEYEYSTKTCTFVCIN